MAQGLFGKLIGDKGYLSKDLVATLLPQGIELITPIKRTMKQRLIRLTDKLLLRKRVIVETITDQLKNISQIEHSRHRSAANFRLIRTFDVVERLVVVVGIWRGMHSPPLFLTPLKGEAASI